MRFAKRPPKKTSAKAPKPSRQRRPLDLVAEQAPELIKVPRPPMAAFNPGRPLAGNSLLQAQVEHFHEINQQLPVEHKEEIDPNQIKTEGEASEFIRKITERLHAHHGVHKGKVRKAT
jgi:hypothetical protein